MTKKEDLQPKASNMDRDEGSSVVVEERKHLKELREQSKGKDSCIIFFCKDCQKVVPTTKDRKRYVYTCNECQTKNVAFGTEASVNKFFHLKK